MRFSCRKTGFTLVEIVVVIAIVALLTSMVIGLGNRVKQQGNIKLTESTIEILVTAVELYYQDNSDAMPFETPDIDGDGVSRADEEFVVLEFENIIDPSGSTQIVINNGSHVDLDWSSEAMYYYLSKSPNSRRIIDSIHNPLVTSLDSAKVPLEVDIAGNNIVMLRVIDAWGNALRYRYTAGDTFCVITSPGKDKLYGTADDITSSN